MNIMKEQAIDEQHKHIDELNDQGWTRVDINPIQWVALQRDSDGNFGGTLWTLGSDSGYHSASEATAGFPVELVAAQDFTTIALKVAQAIKEGK
jgi:hypothetical protein